MLQKSDYRHDDNEVNNNEFQLSQDKNFGGHRTEKTVMTNETTINDQWMIETTSDNNESSRDINLKQ